MNTANSFGTTGALLALGVVLVAMNGCEVFGDGGCAVDEDAVKECRRVLRNHDAEPDAQSALNSLNREYREYKSGQESCERFHPFFQRHIRPVCDRYDDP